MVFQEKETHNTAYQNISHRINLHHTHVKRQIFLISHKKWNQQTLSENKSSNLIVSSWYFTTGRLTSHCCWKLSPRTCWCCSSLWYVQSISFCGLQHENWWSSKIRNHALGWERCWNLLQPWMLLAAHCLSTTLREQGRLPLILTRPSAPSIIHVVFNMLHTHSVWGYNRAEIFVWDFMLLVLKRLLLSSLHAGSHYLYQTLMLQ